MSNEKSLENYISKELIEKMSKMPPMVIETAYLHALNYTMYGVSVTEKWLTATQNAYNLEEAYRKGYDDAMQRQKELDFEERDRDLIKFMVLFYGEEVYEKRVEDEMYKEWVRWRSRK